MNWDIGLQSHVIDARCQGSLIALINEKSHVIASFGMPIQSANHQFFTFPRKTVIGRFLRLRFFVVITRFLFYFITKFNLKIDLI